MREHSVQQLASASAGVFAMNASPPPKEMLWIGSCPSGIFVFAIDRQSSSGISVHFNVN
jgi:hypothetical protein